MVPVTLVFSRAAQYLSAGRMRPAGRRLDSTAIKHPMWDQIELSFVFLDIRAL